MLGRIYRLLQEKERKQLFKMALGVFFNALLNFLSLAMLLPVLYFLLEENSQKQAALFFCLLAFGVVLLKYLLGTYLLRYQNQCLLSFYRRLSFHLFSSYYQRGLLFIREHGSNKLGHEINAICYAFSHSLLAPICRMAGDILLVLLITIALLCWKGKLVLLLFLAFIPFMGIYFLVVRKRVQQYGKDDLTVKREQSRIVMDTFRGYIDMEVNGAFASRQASFLEGMDKISQTRIKLDNLMRLPMFLSEMAVVLGLCLLLLFAQGDISMMVGVFAIAAFRLLPALRNILSSWTQIQNASHCLDTIEDGLKNYNENEAEDWHEIKFEKLIQIQDLSYAYPDGNLVLNQFNACIRPGEYVGICGASGAGKSTLFNILLGFLEPQSGKILIDDVVLDRQHRSSWMKSIGYVPQEVFIFNGNLAENIALGCQNIDEERVREIVFQVGLGQWLESLPEGIHTRMSEAGAKLSGGQKQRIGIARALYKQAAVLFLDEATSALDNQSEQDINLCLSNLKKDYPKLCILSIAHRDSSLSYCDRIIHLD